MGTEFDWFAADSDGFVALMSSAGHGPIPDCVFDRFDDQQQIEEYFAYLVGHPLMDDWARMILLLSPCGVFVYDWKHWDGPCRRQGLPSVPVPQCIEQFGFPPVLRDGLAVVTEGISTSAQLRPDLLLSCTR